MSDNLCSLDYEVEESVISPREKVGNVKLPDPGFVIRYVYGDKKPERVAQWSVTDSKGTVLETWIYDYQPNGLVRVNTGSLLLDVRLAILSIRKSAATNLAHLAYYIPAILDAAIVGFIFVD